MRTTVISPGTADTQLHLPLPAHTESTLRRFLEERLGRPVTVMLTNNASTMLSVRNNDSGLCVRLHRMFLNTDDVVMDEIVAYLRTRRSALPHFRAFVRSNRDAIRPGPAKKVPLRTDGAYHDLRELYDEINRRYFQDAVMAAITWGTRAPRAAVRNRTVGSYSCRTNTIRINPVLDRKSVPRFYVAFIVYHEMLHAALGTTKQGRRRIVHSREFRRREKLFHAYGPAAQWESRNLR